MKIHKIKSATLKSSKKIVGVTVKSIHRYVKPIDSRHTGKIVPHNNSSYIILALLLIFTGFFMYITRDMVSAVQSSGIVDTSVTIADPSQPPTVGANITSPSNGTNTDSLDLTTTGTCQNNSFVVVYSNDQMAGSTVCTPSGSFQLDLKLNSKDSVITALNFNKSNKAGPKTSPVNVNYTGETQLPTVQTIKLPESPILVPGESNSVASCLSSNGSNISSDIKASVMSVCVQSSKPVDSCADYDKQDLPSSGVLQVVAACVPLEVKAGEAQKLGLLVWGGVPPYAVKVEWGGDRADTLLSLSEPDYSLADVSYGVKGIYDIRILAVDSSMNQTFTKTSIVVIEPDKQKNFFEYIISSLNLSWVDTPVPVYLVAVAITIGFWGGDLFVRHFGPGRKRTIGS